MSKKKKDQQPPSTIVINKKARFEYSIEEHFEAGLVLEGWEVKSLRAGRAQIVDSYILVKDGEAWLLGAQIVPRPPAYTHNSPDPNRTRNLLLQRRELHRLLGAVERRGYAVIPLRMYWKKGRAKIEIALAKGKKTHDKRAAEKDRDWTREKQRIMRGR